MDYYIENPDRLKGQPKRTIADYVEQNGVLVPHRFDSLEEARRSNRDILLRSEHPQEYSGVSGLLDSFGLLDFGFALSDASDVEEVKLIYFKTKDNSSQTPNYKKYCKLLGLNEDDFRRQTSFSIWEALGGANRTITADSTIPNRYHIMTSHSEEIKRRFVNYVIVENGNLVQEFLMPLSKDLKDGLGDLIKVYEQVRNLDRFNSNHCPIMEFQTVDGKDYFLQYHRTRDFSPSGFTLDRELQKGETEVPFVRGATSKEGMDYKVTIYYAGKSMRGVHQPKQSNLDSNPYTEDGSYDFNPDSTYSDPIFSELRVRDRKVQMIHSENVRNVISNIITAHLSRSKLFKPEFTIIHNIADVILPEESFYYLSERAKAGENVYINLHIVSDGRRAFVRRI